MDELKKYLQQNAEKLDLDEPRPQVWEQIRQEVGVAKKTNVVMLVTRWAVAACVLALAGLGIWYMMGDQPSKAPVVAVVNGKPEEKIPAPDKKQPVTETKQAAEEPTNLVAKTVTVPKQRRAVDNPVAAQLKAGIHVLTGIETSFTQVINLQKARVATIPMYAETPEYFNDFKVQIRQMEKDEKTIKADISKRGLNDDLLDQLINLYQQKLNILKQLQIEMNKTNNRFKQNRGPVDSTRTYFLNI
jgi:hypothetical protein